MPKKRKQPRKPRKLHAVPSPRREPDLGEQMSAALHGHPLDLLGLASTMLTLLDAREDGPFRAPRDVDRANLIESFIETRMLETTGLLTALAELCGEEVMAAQIRRELAQRPHPLPTWLSRLGEASASERAIVMTDPLGDGDNVMVGTRFADGREITAVVYIEHNLGGLVKEAFVIPESVLGVVGRMQQLAEDPDVTFTDLEPADARVRITEAIRIAAMTVPPFETDTWPASRRLVEWMVAKLPEGGRGYDIPRWSKKQQRALADRFFRSELGAGLDDELHRDMLEHVLWFGTDYSTGDPLHWSSIAVEILLLNWLPRKIADTTERLAAIPDLLRAFVRFCHAEQGIRPGLTDEVLETISLYQPEYLEAIAAPRLQGPAALLAGMGALDPDAAADMMFDPDGEFNGYDEYDEYDDFDDAEVAEVAEIMLEHVTRAVGSEAALDALDDAPLPDEPFAWAAIPPDIHERVHEVLTLTEACCTDLLDEQYRTVTRRLLADAAAADPAIFRRKSRAEPAAAAICWIAGAANSLFRRYGPEPKIAYVKDFVTYFGLKPNFHPSQRATTFLRAIGIDPHARYGSMDLGNPRYLTAARRAEIIELRDRYRAMLKADGPTGV